MAITALVRKLSLNQKVLRPATVVTSASPPFRRSTHKTSLTRDPCADSCNPEIIRPPCPPPAEAHPTFYRHPSPCDCTCLPKCAYPCFDKDKMKITMGTISQAKVIASFLKNNFWPREPSVCAAWMPCDSCYLKTLTDKYSTSGYRYIASEIVDRTNELRMIGFLYADKTFAWVPDELEEWSKLTCCPPEAIHMLFRAHCYKSSNVFCHYKVPYIFEMDAICTVPDVTGQGVAQALLTKAMDDALEARHPIVACIATSVYVAKVCSRIGMERIWSMKYDDYVNSRGHNVLYARPPHEDVSIYIKKLGSSCFKCESPKCK